MRISVASVLVWVPVGALLSPKNSRISQFPVLQRRTTFPDPDFSLFLLLEKLVFRLLRNDSARCALLTLLCVLSLHVLLTVPDHSVVARALLALYLLCSPHHTCDCVLRAYHPAIQLTPSGRSLRNVILANVSRIAPLNTREVGAFAPAATTWPATIPRTNRFLSTRCCSPLCLELITATLLPGASP